MKMEFPLGFPLELTDLICTKIDIGVITDICVEKVSVNKILGNNSLFRLNRKRIKFYWGNIDPYYLIKYDDLRGLKYCIEYQGFPSFDIYAFIGMACYWGNLEMLKFLERYFPVKNQLNYCAYEASSKGHTHILEYLNTIKGDALWDLDGSLIHACSNGHLDTVKYLVEIGANVKVNNYTPMITAINKGYTDIIRYLTSKGGNIVFGIEELRAINPL